MKYALIVVTLVMSGLPVVYGSESEPTVSDILSNVWQDQRAIVTAPWRADRNERILWGATGASLIALMPAYNSRRSLDEKWSAGIERDKPMYGTLFKRVTLLGDGGVLFGASVATYGFSSLTDSPRTQRFSAHWIEALVDTSLWVTALKVLAGRNRPQKIDPESEFAGPGGYFKNQGVNSSFPSGHTALAFASAAVFTRESGNNPWVGVPAYLVASGVGFSRMYVEKHWLSDVLIGAAIGHSVGNLVENRQSSEKKTAFRVVPVLDLEEPRVQVVYQW